MTGAPGESRALAIARRLGFPEMLVKSAESRLVRRGGEAEELMEDMRDIRVEAERLRAEAEDRVLEAERRLEELASERRTVDEKRAQVEAEAQRGLEERIGRARAELDRTRALLPQLSSDKRKRFEEALDGLARSLDDALLTERRQGFIAGLKKGAIVWVPRFKKRCTVTRIYKDKRQLGVKLGTQVLVVGFDDVTFYESL